jgi:hypothetical protein
MVHNTKFKIANYKTKVPLPLSFITVIKKKKKKGVLYVKTYVHLWYYLTEFLE